MARSRYPNGSKRSGQRPGSADRSAELGSFVKTSEMANLDLPGPVYGSGNLVEKDVICYANCMGYVKYPKLLWLEEPGPGRKKRRSQAGEKDDKP